MDSSLDLGKYGDWEIGTVYKSKKTNKYFVAVTNEKLVTFDKGKFQVFTTGEKHIARPNLSFKQLSKIWKTTAREIDSYMTRWLAPDEETKRLKKEKQEKRWECFANNEELIVSDEATTSDEAPVEIQESSVELLVDD